MTSQTKLPMTPTRFFRVIEFPRERSLQLAQLLHLERRDRADNAGGKWKRARNNAARFDCGFERAALHLRAQRSEEGVSCLSDSTSEDDRIRIEEVEEIRHTSTEKPGSFADDFSGGRIAALRGIIDSLRCDLPQVAVDHAHENGLALVAAECFPRTFRDGRPGGVRLEASVIPAFAAAPGGVDRGVADLSGDVRCAVVQLTLENQSPTDSGSQSHADHVSATDRGTAPELAECGAIGIVVERGFETHPARDLVAQRKILPTKVRRHDDDAILAIERSRRSDADAQKRGLAGARFRDRLGDHLLDHSGDSIDDRGGAAISERLSGAHRDLTAAIDGHRSCDDVGAAQIYSDDVTLLRTHTGTGGLRTSISKLETYSGVSSRMQRQCPRGHRCGPCRSHGRQDRLLFPATVFRSARGPNPNSGTVGPKIVSVGVPIADARCCGAESLVTIARARPINSADASSGRVPTPLITAPGRSASIICDATPESAFDPMIAILKSSASRFANST